jgi:hypothetical protein
VRWRTASHAYGVLASLLSSNSALETLPFEYSREATAELYLSLLLYKDRMVDISVMHSPVRTCFPIKGNIGNCHRKNAALRPQTRTTHWLAFKLHFQPVPFMRPMPAPNCSRLTTEFCEYTCADREPGTPVSDPFADRGADFCGNRRSLVSGKPSKCVTAQRCQGIAWTCFEARRRAGRKTQARKRPLNRSHRGRSPDTAPKLSDVERLRGRRCGSARNYGSW